MILDKSNINILVYIIIEIIMAISIITMIVLSSMGYSQLQYGLRAISDINRNWALSPIMDIFDGHGDCSGDSSPIIHDQWDGTVTGCDCTNRWSSRIPFQYSNKLNRMMCSYNMTLGGCTNIRPVPAVAYQVWKGVSVCSKRTAKKFNDYVRDSVSASKSCKNGMRACGLMDSIGSTMCVDSNTACPINKIIFQDKSITPPTDFNYKKIELSGNTILYFTNEAVKSNILLEIKLAEGQICIDPREKDTLNKGGKYILDADYYNYGCTTVINDVKYDGRYTAVDSTSMRKLFDQNGITSTLNYLPYFPFNSLDTNINMLTRPFIGWKSSCINDPVYDPDIVNQIAVKIDSLSSSKIVIIVFSCIFFVYYFIATTFKWCYSMKDSYMAFNIIELVSMFFSFIIMIFSFVCLSKVGSYSTELPNFNCGDAITNEIFIEIGNNFASSASFDKTIAWLSIFCILMYLAYLIAIITCVFLSSVSNSSKRNNEGTALNENSNNNNLNGHLNGNRLENDVTPNNVPYNSYNQNLGENQVIQNTYNNQNPGQQIQYNSYNQNPGQQIQNNYNPQNLGQPVNQTNDTLYPDFNELNNNK